MNYLKSYYHKEIIISIIIAMLILMPNVRVQPSIIGSYKTSSPAITANNSRLSLPQMGDCPASPALIGLAMAFGLVAGVCALIGGVVCTIGITSLMDKGGTTPPYDNIHENHIKYNFSQFDN